MGFDEAPAFMRGIQKDLQYFCSSCSLNKAQYEGHEYRPNENVQVCRRYGLRRR